MKKKTPNPNLNHPNSENFRCIILSCGIIIITVGIWLSITNTNTSGTILSNRYGKGTGTKITLAGPGVIFAGILISAFPAYQLMKNKHNNN